MAYEPGFYESDVEFNRNHCYESTNKILVEINLSAFQKHKNGRCGKQQVSSMCLSLIFGEDGNDSGVIDEARLKLKTYDGDVSLFDIDEIDPEELFWVGKTLLRIAKHFGIDDDEVKKLNDEKIASHKQAND